MYFLLGKIELVVIVSMYCIKWLVEGTLVRIVLEFFQFFLYIQDLIFYRFFLVFFKSNKNKKFKYINLVISIYYEVIFIVVVRMFRFFVSGFLQKNFVVIFRSYFIDYRVVGEREVIAQAFIRYLGIRSRVGYFFRSRWWVSGVTLRFFFFLLRGLWYLVRRK